ncbi:60S ribosomal protein [Mycena kentingensis (nom. inval.)]|nr:60S ribosomal protein [Mycena kentingensis (nom. inval.)]
MDSWPAFSQRKGKDIISYPLLEHGTLAAARLVQNEHTRRLDWEQITAPASSRDALRVSQATLVYPQTRPRVKKTSNMSIRQQAEQGANFIRTHLSDVDISAELIRAELTEDAKLQRQLDVFDPFVGNQLEVVHCDDVSWLSFPMGDVGRDLNLSPLKHIDGKWEFSPLGHPIHTFNTPILQIAASETKAPFLAARTFGGSIVLRIDIDGEDLFVDELGTIKSSDIGGKHAVDVKLAPRGELTLVNGLGALYRWDPKMNSTRLLVELGEADDDFWRVELTNEAESLLLMSKSNLSTLDFRAEGSAAHLYSASPKEILTSTEAGLSERLISLCTTQQLLWFDRRKTSMPLLAIKHGRAFDRSLQTRTISTSNGPITLLSSRKHGLLSVYDVGASAQQVLPPYCLTAGAAHGTQKAHCFVNGASSTAFFRLSEDGAIHAFEMSFDMPGPVVCTWSEDVQRLHEQAADLQEDYDDFQLPQKAPVDMRPLYERILKEPKEDATDQVVAESFYDLVERASSFWQETGEPVDHMLTSYDILFRSGEEPNQSTRADFLSDSVLKTKRGYRAFSKGRVTTDILKRGAPWTYDLTKTLSILDPEFKADIQGTAEHLKQFNLRPELQRSVESETRETRAREQLALDLELSRHIYSPRPLGPTSDVADDLESMTKTLSLDEPVQFNHLRPAFEEGQISAGVRALTRDWVLGQDPKDFVYRERDADEAEDAVGCMEETRIEPLKAAPQRPPTLVIASSQRPPAMQASQPVLAASQPMEVDFSGISQEYIPSTQPVAGPYGARPKKAPKKRVGGF